MTTPRIPGIPAAVEVPAAAVETAAVAAAVAAAVILAPAFDVFDNEDDSSVFDDELGEEEAEEEEADPFSAVERSFLDDLWDWIFGPEPIKPLQTCWVYGGFWGGIGLTEAEVDDLKRTYGEANVSCRNYSRSDEV